MYLLPERAQSLEDERERKALETYNWHYRYQRGLLMYYPRYNDPPMPYIEPSIPGNDEQMFNIHH